MGKMIDLTGQKFDMLTIIEKTDKRHSGSVVWKCLCDCGNICERASNTLKRPGHHSCGCYNQIQVSNLNKKDLTNQKFGLLTALYPIDKRDSSGCIFWHCKCECGNECDIRSNSLTSKNTQSCGCINYSIGEKNIEKILKQNHILYISQYTNSKLKLKKFDFAILNNNQIIRLIEFDGEQHFDNKSGI